MFCKFYSLFSDSGIKQFSGLLFTCHVYILKEDDGREGPKTLLTKEKALQSKTCEK